MLENGDQVEILKSEGQEPQPGWLTFAITGKARAAIRRYIRQKQRGEEVALGEKLYEEIIGRFSPELASELGDKELKAALKRLKLDDRASLMVAIATQRLLDSEVMEALIPGSTSAEGVEEAHPRQHAPVSIRSEEHTSELQSLMRNSYAVFCLKKK